MRPGTPGVDCVVCLFQHLPQHPDSALERSVIYVFVGEFVKTWKQSVCLLSVLSHAWQLLPGAPPSKALVTALLQFSDS